MLVIYVLVCGGVKGADDVDGRSFVVVASAGGYLTMMPVLASSCILPATRLVASGASSDHTVSCC